MLKKGAIVEVPSPVFLSSLFVIPKKSGGFRPVINLKGLNQYVVHRHFKMEGLPLLKHLIQPGDWLAKLDLKHAYFTVPIHFADQELLQFKWQEKIYQFNCLPFGLSSAPWAFTKMLKPLIAFFRARGIRLVIYLDDILLMSSSKEKLKEDVLLVRTVLELVGFVVNEEKSICDPSQLIEFLGLIIDSIAMTLSLPSSKVDSLVASCKKLISQPKSSLRELASVMGNFSWAIPAVPFARAHYRNLQSLYNINLKRATEFDGKLTLSEGAILDLRWWISNLSIVNGKSLISAKPSLIIYSDASLLGWGAVCNNVTANGPWSSSDSSRHINELELQAAFNGLQSFAISMSDVAILLMMDNTTAVSYVNKTGGPKSIELCSLAVEMSSWCEVRGISLEAAYLPGSLNILADMESRRSHDSSDWQLAPTAFAAISKTWSTNIDLFAASWNTQLPAFASWFPQPGASRIDALSFSWVGLKGYAFPPFYLIKNCLSKIRREKSELILVCPYWPSQPWYPILLELASAIPLILRPSPNMLLSSMGQPHPLCLKPTFLLIAWKLSGDVSKGRTFRNQLLVSSWQPTVRPHTLLKSAWRSWRRWCVGHDINSMSTNISNVLKFLTDAFLSEKAYSTINIYRSMLSGTYDQLEGFDIGCHPLVLKLMKGIFNSNPPKPKYSSTWDLDVVLDYFKTVSIEDQGLLPLSCKLVTLLAITTMLRVNELASISRPSIIFSGDSVNFSLCKPRKTQKNGPLRSMTLKKHPDRAIDPVYCLGLYVHLTDILRNKANEGFLLIGSVKPHRPITGSTVARWIKKQLEEAGVDTDKFSAHSTRGAAASKAASLGVPVKSILDSADWASESTFSRFYRREVSEPSVAERVLAGPSGLVDSM